MAEVCKFRDSVILVQCQILMLNLCGDGHSTAGPNLSGLIDFSNLSKLTNFYFYFHGKNIHRLYRI